MATPEGLTKDAVRRALAAAEKAGGRVAHWMVIPAAGTVGFPDFMILANGTFIGVECKATKEDGGRGPTKLQIATLDRIEAAGGVSLVVDSHDSFHVLCLTLQGATKVEFEFPAWRSSQVTNRRRPPPRR